MDYKAVRDGDSITLNKRGKKEQQRTKLMVFHPEKPIKNMFMFVG
jgi:hypothetical protein